MTLAERLRAIRELGGIRAHDLAELAGLSEAYVGHIERGRTKSPGVESVGKLALTLGISIDYLTRGEGEPPTKESVTAAIEAARIAKGLARGAGDSDSDGGEAA